MTTAAPPQHGERRCYLRGCRLPECETANYRYMSKLRLDVARGQRRLIDATQTITHTERLIANGWTHTQIASAAGVADRTVGELFKRTTVYTATAQAILSIHIGPPPTPRRNIDATGTRRRVQALVAIGWPVKQLAERVGLNVIALGHIANGDLEQVRATTASTVARHYRHLSCIPGTSVRARNLARKKGWHGPLAWDAIDDPACEPEFDPHADKRGRPAKVDDARVLHLTDEGLTTEQIAWELGCHERTVIRARNRARTTQLFGTAA